MATGEAVDDDPPITLSERKAGFSICVCRTEAYCVTAVPSAAQTGYNVDEFPGWSVGLERHGRSFPTKLSPSTPNKTRLCNSICRTSRTAFSAKVRRGHPGVAGARFGASSAKRLEDHRSAGSLLHASLRILDHECFPDPKPLRFRAQAAKIGAALAKRVCHVVNRPR